MTTTNYPSSSKLVDIASDFYDSIPQRLGDLEVELPKINPAALFRAFTDALTIAVVATYVAGYCTRRVMHSVTAYLKRKQIAEVLRQGLTTILNSRPWRPMPAPLPDDDDERQPVPAIELFEAVVDEAEAHAGAKPAKYCPPSKQTRNRGFA